MLQTLDTIISVVFVFLMFSLVVSAAREVAAAWLHLRGKLLKQGLDVLLSNLGNESLGPSFWNHPLMKMVQTSNSTPSYIPSSNIVSTLLHIAAGNEPGKAADVNALKAKLASMAEHSGLATLIATAIEQSGANATLAEVQSNLEKWINSSMERISSQYQRKTRTWLFLISLVAAAAMNVDAVAIWQRVQSDKALRDSLVAQAAKVELPGNVKAGLATPTGSLGQKPAGSTAAPPDATHTNKTSESKPGGNTNAIAPLQTNPSDTNILPTADLAAATKQYRESLNGLTRLDLPIGWTDDALKQYTGFWVGLMHVFGILASACAASLGAPFWFDLLQRFMNIRSTIQPAKAASK